MSSLFPELFISLVSVLVSFHLVRQYSREMETSEPVPVMELPGVFKE